MVEFSPATREARVRFPAGAFTFFDVWNSNYFLFFIFNPFPFSSPPHLFEPTPFHSTLLLSQVFSLGHILLFLSLTPEDFHTISPSPSFSLLDSLVISLLSCLIPHFHLIVLNVHAFTKLLSSCSCQKYIFCVRYQHSILYLSNKESSLYKRINLTLNWWLPFLWSWFWALLFKHPQLSTRPGPLKSSNCMKRIWTPETLG